jgi:hypothetical protein
MRGFLRSWQVLLLLLAASSLQQGPQHSSSSSRHFLLAASAAAAEAAPSGSLPDILFPNQLLDDQTTPIWQKPGNVSATSADVAAPASVRLRYRAPGRGSCGRWDNFDYGDVRNNNPGPYCPSSCRKVSSRVARCQCVTRSSLNAFYSGWLTTEAELRVPVV